MSKKKKFLIIIFSFLVIFITSFCISLTYARFVSGVSGSSRTSVAKFVIDFNTSNNLLNIPLDYTSDSDTYYFEVSNSNTIGDSSSVNTLYDLIIDTSSNLPLIFELYKYNDSNDKYDILVELNNGVSKKNLLNFSKHQVDKYMIKISYDKNNKDYRYSNSIDYLLIKFNAYQVD